jgi:hypothetical protein
MPPTDPPNPRHFWPRKRSEIILVIVMLPVIGIVCGGIYPLLATWITRERDPWHTLVLGIGLSLTVFDLGSLLHLAWPSLGYVWLSAIVFLLLVRVAFGLRGNFEHFGFVHMLTLALLFVVCAITHPATRMSAAH